MRSLLHQSAILHCCFTIIIIPSISSLPFPIPFPSPATPISPPLSLLPHLLNTTSPPTTHLPLTIWPTLPWWTKLRNPALDPNPPCYLDIFALSPQTHPATPHQATILQESVLLPLARQIHEGQGPWADEPVVVEVGGVGASWAPMGEGLAQRVVVATAVAALAHAEMAFGVRGVSGGVSVGRVEVGGLVVWVGEEG